MMPYPFYFTDMPVTPPGGANPPMGVRVVSGVVWDIIYRQWQLHRLAGSPPPKLGPPSAQQMFFSDPQSVTVCTRAEDFALRLTMYPTDVQDTRDSGCAIIFLPTQSMNVARPSPTPAYGITPSTGLTVGGAR